MIGFHTNSHCGETIQETLELISAAGFKYVMLYTKSSELEDGIRIARKLGLEVVSAHLPYRQPHGINVDNFWKRGVENDKLIGSLIEQIKICGKYKVGIVVIHSCNDSRNGIFDVAHGIASLRKILSATKTSNVKIAVENIFPPHNNEYFFAMLDSIDDPRLGLCYDSGHHYLTMLEFDLLGKYGDRCFAIHLHDNLMDASNLNHNDRDIHLLPFDGKIDFKKVMRDIARSSYTGPVMLESKQKREAFETLYANMTSTEFLQEAYKRGEKLAKMLDRAKTRL